MTAIGTDTFLLVGMVLAFGAGALSFLSPCVLPIFPAYLSYITGISVNELQGNRNIAIQKRLMSHSLVFLLGVSLVFISLGAGASYFGQWIQQLLMGDSGLFIQRVAGIFIFVMGLFVGGWITIKTLMREQRFHFKNRPTGFIGTFLVGLGFAAGWTPCIGPVFGSILMLSASQPGQGMLYTLMYVFGFIFPFILLTFFLGSTKWIVRKSQVIMKLGGAMMVIMGMVLFFGQMPVITGLLLDLIEGTWLEKLG